MAPGAKRIKKLLYISDVQSDSVFVYNYETGTQVGQLVGFNYPQGQCVDRRGDVWVANFGYPGSQGSSVVEYAHGGSRPIATVKPTGSPMGCSIDPVTGDLAVGNWATPYGYGDIQIWENPSSAPTTYVNDSCGRISSPGFDASGNLYAEGAAVGGRAVCEIPKNGTALEPIRVNQVIYGISGVMWDGQFITLSDDDPFGRSVPVFTIIYQAVESSDGDLAVVGETNLSGACRQTIVQQPFIVGETNTPANHEQGTTVVGGVFGGCSSFDYWSYAAGGTPRFALKSVPVSPQGQSVSIAPR